MKKWITLTLLTSMIVSSVGPIVHAETPKENVIIVFKDDIDKMALENVNGQINELFDNIPVVAGEIPEAAIGLLEKDKDVLAVEVDQRVKINAEQQEWGIKAVNAPASWESEYTGKGIKIAVLDTGITPHEDLIVAGGVSITPYTNSYHDDNGHGLHVAGIIGAEKDNGIGIVGTAPDADLYAVKVLDKNGSGYLSDIIAGIDWSISNNMDIINMSLGAPSDSLALKQAVDKATKSGIMVVAAAGNNGKEDGSGDTVEYPAKYESVVAVAATDQSNDRGIFSATGDAIEVAAPGVQIVSTYLNNEYAVMSGTSMAAPYVAGVVALMKQQHPAITNLQLREKLKSTTIDLGNTGKDVFFGYGLVQAPVKMKESPVQEQTDPEPAKTQPIQAAPAPNVEKVPNNPSSPVQQQPEKPAPKPNVTKPTPKKNFLTTISTYRSTYYAGNTIRINIKVTDKGTKKAVPNSTVRLTVTPPKSRATIVTLKTNSKGEVSYKMVVSKKTVKGTYKLLSATSNTNYNVTYVSKSIIIK